MFKNLITVLAFKIALFSFFNVNAQNNLEVCYNPNLVKDTSKKLLVNMLFLPSQEKENGH